jgi:hypothetical protein
MEANSPTNFSSNLPAICASFHSTILPTVFPTKSAAISTADLEALYSAEFTTISDPFITTIKPTVVNSQ